MEWLTWTPRPRVASGGMLGETKAWKEAESALRHRFLTSRVCQVSQKT